MAYKILTQPPSNQTVLFRALLFEKRGFGLVGPLHNSSCIKSENYIFAEGAMLSRGRYPNVAVVGDRKFHIEKPENLRTVLQHFYMHYTYKIKFFAQVVTITFLDKPEGRQDNCMNCDNTKSKS